MTNRHTVLITGASSGIGLAAARLLDKEGFIVYGTSRNARGNVDGIEYLELDLTDESSIEAFLKSIPPVDVLINNAGASQMGAIEETPLSKMRKLYDLIFFGHIRIIQGVLPGMRERGGGLIINVTSLAEIMPVPCSSVYASGKAALHILSAGLRHEVRPFGIQVTSLAPSFINTPIVQERLSGSESPYAGIVENAGKVRDHNISAGSDPVVIARKILKIIKKRNPKSFYVAGKNARILYTLYRVLPEKFKESMVRRVFSLPDSHCLHPRGRCRQSRRKE